jgi:Ca2+-binding RTX toxin-like protein
LRQLPQASFGTAGANLKCIFQNRLIELFEFVAGTWRPAFNGGSDSTIGETLLRIYGGIDDLVTGDGEDIISGNDVGNWLRGMRGVDQFIGYGGNDMTWTRNGSQARVHVAMLNAGLRSTIWILW